MKKNKIDIRDLHHVAGDSFPASPNIFYQCLKCWTILNSKPPESLFCKCGNLSIDIDYGRAGARDEDLVRVLEVLL